MNVFLASDHAGYGLKERVKKLLLSQGVDAIDCGAFSTEPCDYPDYVIPACEAVAANNARGIVFGGSGIGECIAANKVKGIRAALAYDVYTARVTREHNDSNVLCLGGRTVTRNFKLTKRIVLAWLKTPFSRASRHKRRIRKISDYERKAKPTRRKIRQRT